MNPLQVALFSTIIKFEINLFKLCMDHSREPWIVFRRDKYEI